MQPMPTYPSAGPNQFYLGRPESFYLGGPSLFYFGWADIQILLGIADISRLGWSEASTPAASNSALRPRPGSRLPGIPCTDMSSPGRPQAQPRSPQAGRLLLRPASAASGRVAAPCPDSWLAALHRITYIGAAPSSSRAGSPPRPRPAPPRPPELAGIGLLHAMAGRLRIDLALAGFGPASAALAGPTPAPPRPKFRTRASASRALRPAPPYPGSLAQIAGLASLWPRRADPAGLPPAWPTPRLAGVP